jgi:hypothetical protein
MDFQTQTEAQASEGLLLANAMCAAGCPGNGEDEQSSSHEPELVPLYQAFAIALELGPPRGACIAGEWPALTALLQRLPTGRGIVGPVLIDVKGLSDELVFHGLTLTEGGIRDSDIRSFDVHAKAWLFNQINVICRVDGLGDGLEDDELCFGIGDRFEAALKKMVEI